MSDSLFAIETPPTQNLRDSVFFSWNLLHGGGSRIAEIALVLAEADPDLVVLTEFRSGAGGALRGLLADRGLEHQLTTEAHRTQNGMLVAARTPLHRAEIAGERPGDRLLLALATDWQLAITAAHLPCDVPSDPRFSSLNRLWKNLVKSSKTTTYEHHAIIGDLNADRAAEVGARPGTPAFRLGQLATLGYVDAFIASGGDRREISWRGHRGESARLDHTLLSPALAPRLRSASYLGSPLARRVSDHAPMVVRLKASDGRARAS
ncbi:MAG: endonuclease/exonuclease/phosphatase family protein [Planctomycetota bacterium]